MTDRIDQDLRGERQQRLDEGLLFDGFFDPTSNKSIPFSPIELIKNYYSDKLELISFKKTYI